MIVTKDQNKSIRTNKEEQEYQKVIQYLRKVYPVKAFELFCNLFDGNKTVRIFALLGFLEQQPDSLVQVDQMAAGFKSHLQQQLQIQDFGAHCAEHSGSTLQKEQLDNIITDILRAHLFMVHYCIKMYPAVKEPPAGVTERIRKDLESQVKRMRMGDAILVQIPTVDRVFSKSEEFEDFKKCTSIDEIEKKINTYEKGRTRNISPGALQSESESVKYALIMKGVNQPLILPPQVPPTFQEALDQSIAEGKPVCIEHKGKGPDGKDFEIGVCAFAILKSDAASVETVPEDLVRQLAQAESATHYMPAVIEMASKSVRMVVL